MTLTSQQRMERDNKKVKKAFNSLSVIVQKTRERLWDDLDEYEVKNLCTIIRDLEKLGNRR